MLYRHNASDPIIMERPSRAAYAGPSFQKAIASVASAIDGAALNNPAKLFGRKTSASRAKVETANPPMKKRMTYSVTPRPPRGHAVKPASTFPDASGDRHSSKIVDYPRATAAAPTCSPSRSKVSTPSFVCIERMSRSPKASCILLRTALEHGTAGGTEVATVTRHARPDTANVRDVLLAEPHRVRFTGRALLRGPLLRGGGPSRKREREAQQHRRRGCDRPELWLGATNVHYRPPFGDHVFRLIHGFLARTSRRPIPSPSR